MMMRQGNIWASSRKKEESNTYGSKSCTITWLRAPSEKEFENIDTVLPRPMLSLRPPKNLCTSKQLTLEVVFCTKCPAIFQNSVAAYIVNDIYSRGKIYKSLKREDSQEPQEERSSRSFKGKILKTKNLLKKSLEDLYS